MTSRIHLAVLFSVLSSFILVGGCDSTLSYNDGTRRDGVALYNQGQYDQAAGTFRNAVKGNPRDYESYYWLGQSYASMKNWAQAINAHQTALDVMQLTVDGKRDVRWRREITNGLAFAIASSPARSQEIQRLEDAKHGRETADDALLMARIFYYGKDADSAIDAYNRAVLLDPQDMGIAKEAGLYFASIGKNQFAEPLLKRAYNADPKDERVAAALRNLGIVPGPSLKNETELVKPPVPLGPIPQLGGPQTPSNPPGGGELQTPRV